MSVGVTGGSWEFAQVAAEKQIIGVKKIYEWSQLERSQGKYNFDEIADDLEYLRSIGKRLWIQIGTHAFTSSQPPITPSYMWNNTRYGCGPEYYGNFRRNTNGGGWLPCYWDPDVIDRFVDLVTALGRRFNKEPNFEGISLGETAIDVRAAKEQRGYSSGAVRRAFERMASAAKFAFPSKSVIQMINYAPYDLASFAAWLTSRGIGIGSPDVKTGTIDSKLSTAYALHIKYHNVVPTGPDIQWGNYTQSGATVDKLFSTAVTQTNPWYLFWVKREPYFKNKVLPLTRKRPLPAAGGY